MPLPMPRPVVPLAAASAEADSYLVPPEKRLAGNPRQTVWMQYEDPSKRFFVGEWHSEVGKWKVSYTEEEYCEMLSGTSVVTDEAGRSETFRAGDCFVVPRGFVGTWEVVEPTRKRFVIYEAGTTDA
jgi:uncharacterized protein